MSKIKIINIGYEETEMYTRENAIPERVFQS